MVTKKTRQKEMASHALALAVLFIDGGDYSSALNQLSLARNWARAINTQRGKAMAVYCTVAMQKVIPLALEKALEL